MGAGRRADMCRRRGAGTVIGQVRVLREAQRQAADAIVLRLRKLQQWVHCWSRLGHLGSCRTGALLVRPETVGR